MKVLATLLIVVLALSFAMPVHAEDPSKIDVSTLSAGDEVKSLRTATSKTTLVSKVVDKGAVKSMTLATEQSIGINSYKDDKGVWLDCNPQWVSDVNGWRSEGTQILAYVYQDGSRLIYPDRYDLSKSIQLGAFSGFKDLKLEQKDSQTLIMRDKWGEFRFIVSNSGIHFETYFTSEQPFTEIVFPVVSTYDINALLSAKDGIGIPNPRIINSDSKQVSELVWIYDGHSLALPFDFKNLNYPLLIANTTVEIQILSSTNDGYWHGATYSSNDWQAIAGKTTESWYSWLRFPGITIPQSATINTAYIIGYGAGSYGLTRSTLYYGEKANNPAYTSSIVDYGTRVKTTASVADSTGYGSGSWANGPEIKTIIQELVNDNDYSNEAIQILWEDNGSGANCYIGIRTYDYTGNDKGAKLHIEYTSTVAPTVTISAATSISANTATLNGNVTATGGENPSVKVYYGTTDHAGTSVGWDHEVAPTSPAQPQGVASFYLDVTSLIAGTTYYFTASATNSAGTDWPASSLSFTTLTPSIGTSGVSITPPFSGTPIFAILPLLVLLTVLAYLRGNAVFWMITAGVAMMGGLYAPRGVGDSYGVTMGIMLIMYAFVCLGFAYAQMFREKTE